MNNKIIAVDFDGTLCISEYPKIIEPRTEVIKELLKEQKAGAKIILWTCREGDLLQEAVDYCASKGLEFYAVNSNFPEENADIIRARKLEAELFIDDRNLGGIPDWGVIYQMVMSGNSFQPVPQGNIAEEPKRKKGLFGIFG
jgi:predicted amidohydrolase